MSHDPDQVRKRGERSQPSWQAWLLVVATIAGLTLIAAAAARAVRQRADGASILFVVTDETSGRPRADAIVLATWHRRCDTVALTFIPRDLVVRPGGEQLAIVFDTDGPRGMAAAIAEMIDARIAALAITDVRGVEQISAAMGPVTVDLTRESVDRQTGFHGGPGPIDLVGTDAVAYLRSRTWEERHGDRWVTSGNSDLGRIERATDFVERAIRQIRTSGSVSTARVLGAAFGNGHLETIDSLALLGLAWDATTPSQVTFDVLPTMAERSAAQRRSPFDPLDRGTAARLVPLEGTPRQLDPCAHGQETR